MPKGFTEDSIRAVIEMTKAAYSGDTRRYVAAGNQFREALLTDQKNAREAGVPDDYFDSSQQREIGRVLRDNFPVKDIGIEYNVGVLLGEDKFREAEELVERESNPIQRGVLYGRIGELDKARRAIIEGVGGSLQRLVGQYAIDRSEELEALISEVTEFLDRHKK